ncbi:ABC transporter permease subunit [Synechococcus sp. CS-1325]|uniref:ABC transporter permease n=1 Tax=unclassified Synechococcus TaxID=2626047 RepID=UPI000DB20746|nr:MULTISPECIES: ABC transporter permease subunit [unclassified Synechococcus]MCT0200156.1 ABC transporter permease subunit [Synechococcus sp. CS-1325]MCT0230271.1 ABC transporter permease subunit [Synechococcus sp. CS-1324]PZV01275.1 MAG: ABC transporter permease [Cyanobium sp.]PZV04228.1 MAG: ABC transporter permease [Cyanobium sp.]
MSRIAARLLTLWAGLAYGLLFAPIVVIVLFSFNLPSGRFNLIWQGFTLENWLHPFRDRALTDAFLTSLSLALAASLIATVLGGLMAIGLSRSQGRAHGAIELLLVLPLTSPEIVLAASLLNLFVQINLPRGFGTLVLAHSLFCLSFAALTMKARLGGVDWSLEAAAQDLGATPLRTFGQITLPLLAPGLLAAFLLSFSLSLDDYIISAFTAGQVIVFPLYIAGAFQREISPQIHVMATMVLLVSIGLLGLGLGSKDGE